VNKSMEQQRAEFEAELRKKMPIWVPDKVYGRRCVGFEDAPAEPEQFPLGRLAAVANA
jgi:hypothetical protein